MNRFIPLVLGAAALAGCAATAQQQQASFERDARDQAKLEERLAGFTPGKPVSCVTQTRLRGSQVYGGTILYEVSPSLVYRNNTNGSCGNGRDDILVTRTPTGQLCSGEIVQTIDRFNRFPTGGCSLGEFIPYERDRSEQGG